MPSAPHIHVDESGDPSGPAVLLLHGLGGDATMWQPQLAALPPGLRALTWEARGHGRSAWPGTVTVDDWVADIVSVLDARNIESVALVGLSMGGIQALALAARAPERVHAIAVASTWLWLEEESLQRKLDNLPRRAAAVGLAQFAPAYVSGMFAEPDSAPARAYARTLSTMPLEAYVQSAHACFEVDLRAEATQIEAPTLVLWGTSDDRMPRPLSEAVAAAVPGAELVDLPGAGHMCNVEAAAQFNAALNAFLARQS